ncbi:MAG: ABC transporter permease [Prevotella sp.]|nr:ABC transporter permease [Prevotella sp.]
MKLVWKLLRQHLSVPQMLGFAMANLFGLFIVLLGHQFYRDVMPVFTSADSFMKSEYLIVSKQVASLPTAQAQGFTAAEVDEIGSQPFVKTVGMFTSAAYKVTATILIDDTPLLTSEMPIESVPDSFVGNTATHWAWTPASAEVPIILPRSFLTMYNFGFSRSHSMPRISESMVSMLKIQMRVGPHSQLLQGRVIGLSPRLNAILVPHAFMQWSNNTFANGAEEQPTRLLIDVDNPTDQRIAPFIEEHSLQLEDGNLDAEKTTYFLRLVVTIVMVVGLVISLLSFYILMLSIYLLVQKNATKLQNLLLIGYSPTQVALPYQLLTMALSLAVLLIALTALWAARNHYLDLLYAVYPDIEEATTMATTLLGVALMAAVTLINSIAIRKKIQTIWKHKD